MGQPHDKPSTPANFPAQKHEFLDGFLASLQPDVISVNPSLGAWAPATAVSRSAYAFLPPRHRPSPVHYRGRLPACPRRNDFMTDPFFETAAISLCSGPQVCSPPRSFLPLRLIVAGQPRLLRR